MKLTEGWPAFDSAGWRVTVGGGRRRRPDIYILKSWRSRVDFGEAFRGW